MSSLSTRTAAPCWLLNSPGNVANKPATTAINNPKFAIFVIFIVGSCYLFELANRASGE
jgi:hypothetical protein